MKKNLSITIAAILAIGAPAMVNAQLSFTATIGGVPSVAGATLETFNGPMPSFLTLSGFAAIETGPTFGLLDGGAYASPYFSGSTAAYFGESPNTGSDSTKFVAVASGGTATMTFPAPERYFGLLIGSIDVGNTLNFYDSANNLIGAVTGNQILAASSALPGDTGPQGTAYVNITSTTPFSKVVATFASPSFEFDDVAYAQTVPEPSSLVLAGLGGLATLLAFRRRSK